VFVCRETDSGKNKLYCTRRTYLPTVRSSTVLNLLTVEWDLPKLVRESTMDCTCRVKMNRDNVLTKYHRGAVL
jgi:hypothetical protein